MVSARGDSQPATDDPESGLTSSAADRRRALVAGHKGDFELAIELSRHDSPSVRVAALAALDIAGHLAPEVIVDALGDPDSKVRRRACELSGRQTASGADLDGIIGALVGRLSDAEPLVAETAAWALGELAPRAKAKTRRNAVGSLAATAGHGDPLCREAAVAALGRRSATLRRSKSSSLLSWTSRRSGGGQL